MKAAEIRFLAEKNDAKREVANGPGLSVPGKRLND
jgi:hypothetical protein